eukprot:31202-Pelagococcus_subviridis.AAC.2
MTPERRPRHRVFCFRVQRAAESAFALCGDARLGGGEERGRRKSRVGSFRSRVAHLKDGPLARPPARLRVGRGLDVEDVRRRARRVANDSAARRVCQRTKASWSLSFNAQLCDDDENLRR